MKVRKTLDLVAFKILTAILFFIAIFVPAIEITINKESSIVSLLNFTVGFENFDAASLAFLYFFIPLTIFFLDKIHKAKNNKYLSLTVLSVIGFVISLIMQPLMAVNIEEVHRAGSVLTASFTYYSNVVIYLLLIGYSIYEVVVIYKEEKKSTVSLKVD